MEKLLKQDEIDALFQAAHTSASDSTQPGTRARVVPYNFATSGQISNEQLRAISMLNDLFARNLTHNLAAWLRTRFQVNLVSAEQIPFNEFLLRIPEISYVASVRLEPLGALSVLQLDLALAPPIIDLLLGGEGKDGPLRELTDIEESILASVVEIVCRELTAAWVSVSILNAARCRRRPQESCRSMKRRSVSALRFACRTVPGCSTSHFPPWCPIRSCGG
jgi:flagellar motor switch protein FliM